MPEWLSWVTIAGLWASLPYMTRFIASTNTLLIYITLRAIIEAGILVFIALFVTKRSDTPVELDGKLKLTPLAALMAACATSLFQYKVTRSESTTVLVAVTYPLGITFTLLIGRLIFNEHLCRRKILGIVLCAVACVVLSS